VPVRHSAKQTSRDNWNWEVEQEQQRREEAIANTTGLGVICPELVEDVVAVPGIGFFVAFGGSSKDVSYWF
jgi:hypothetical protein